MAVTAEESYPPLKKIPTGTSACNLYSIADFSNFSVSSIASHSEIFNFG
jgi:hypothetical protein